MKSHWAYYEIMRNHTKSQQTTILQNPVKSYGSLRHLKELYEIIVNH